MPGDALYSVFRLRGKAYLIFVAVTTTTGLAMSLGLQAVAVGNPAYRDAPLFSPSSGLFLPAVICPLIWFQLGSFEAELNPLGRVKSSEPALSLLTFES